MRKLVSNKLVIFTLTFMMLVLVTTNCLAAEGDAIVIDPNAILNPGGTTNSQTPAPTDPIVNQVNEINDNTVLINNVQPNNSLNVVNTTNDLNSTNSTYQNQDLPKTGSNDYAIFALIAVCVVSAIYAYKKIRDYNVK